MPGLFDLDQGIVAAESENEKLLKKARSLCIRELYDRALEIYNGILDEDPECLQAYLGILKVHSENYTKYDSEDIERDIRVINRAFEDVEDEEFLSYLQDRKKALKGKEPKKEEKPAEEETNLGASLQEQFADQKPAAPTPAAKALKVEVNGAEASLTPEENPGNDVAVYKVTLAIGDKLVVKGDGVALPLGETEATEFTCKVAGEHTVYVNKEYKVYVVEPAAPTPALSEEDVEYKKAFVTLRSSEKQDIWFPKLSKGEAESIVKTLTPYAEAGFLKAYCGIIACYARFLHKDNKAEEMIKKAYSLLSGNYDFDDPCHVYILTAYAKQVDRSLYQKLADAGYHLAYALLGDEVYDGIESVRCWRRYLETPEKNEYLPFSFMSFLDENGDHTTFGQKEDFSYAMGCVYQTLDYYKELAEKASDPMSKSHYMEIVARWRKVHDEISENMNTDPIKAMRKNGIGPNDD